MKQKSIFFNLKKQFQTLFVFSSFFFALLTNAQLTHTTITTGLSGPSGMAKDSAGNIYVANYTATGSVVKIDASGNILSTFTGFAYPIGVAVDQATGEIYVVEKNSPNIVKMDASGNNRQNFNISFDMSQPNGICLGGNGKLYVTSSHPANSFGDQKILQMNVDGTGKQFIGRNDYGAVTTIALNAAGNKLYLREGGRVRRVNLDGSGDEVILASGNGVGLALDASDNVYVADNIAWELKKINNANNSVSTIYNNLSFSYLAIDQVGNLFFNISGGTEINKVVNSLLSTQNTAKKSISVSPNPAKDFTVINGITSGTEVSVLDATGKLVFKTKATGTSLTLSTSSFQNGVYLVKAGNTTVKLMVSK